MSFVMQLQSGTFTHRLLGAVIFAAILIANPAYAQESDVAAEAVEESDAEQESVHPKIDLGMFKINDLRPTRNETAKVTFSLHLAFSKDLSDAQVAELEHWKHRLRDQVITAIRITLTKDFQEPDLSRLRRKILIRVNRLFPANLAEEVLLTEYRFRTH